MAKQDLFKKAIELKLISEDSVEKDFTVVQLEELIKKGATVVPKQVDDKLDLGTQEKPKEAIKEIPKVDYKKLYEDLVAKTEEESKGIEVPVEKTLSNSANETVQDNVSDVVLMGVKTNNWRLLCKAYSKKEGWMKSSKALDLVNTRQVLVQTTTQQRNADGSYAIVDALTHVDGRLVESEEKGIWMIAQ